MTALGESDGTVRDAERRAGFRWSPRRSNTPRHRARPRGAARRPTASSAGARAECLGVAVLQQLDQLLHVHDHVYLSWLSASRSLRRESDQSRSNQEESQLSTASKKPQYRRRLTLRWSRPGIRVCRPAGARKLSTAVLRRLSADFGATSAALDPSLDHPVRSRVLCPHARKAVDKSPQESDQQVSCERFWPPGPCVTRGA